MVLRDYYLAKNQTVADTATVTVQIPVGLKIQHIRVKYRATNGATSNTVAKLNGMVSKIEVVDGSDLLHSLSMQELQAFNCFHNFQFPFKLISAAAAAVVQEEAVIEFGRFIGDPAFYLDTARTKNPQVRLTHALTISATAGFATGTGAIDVIARVIDSGAEKYAGYFMRKEQRSISTAASGDDAAILALDYPYSELLMQAKKTTILPDAIITNFKLLINAGQLTPFDMNATDLLADNIERFGMFEEEYVPLSDTAATFLSDLYYKTGAVFDIAGATGLGKISSVTAESIVAAMTTGQAAGTMRVKARGAAPHSCFYFPWLDPNVAPYDLTTMFDASKGVSEMKLLSTQGTSAAVLNICSGQHRS